MQFCSRCGHTVSFRVPDGDNLPRFVCDNCNTIHYQNPRIIAGCIPEWDNRLLLCKRAIEPRHGLWTLPAGFMENGETTQQAAMRETLEEASAEVLQASLFCIFSIPHISQVYMMFRGQVKNGIAHPGVESLEVDYYHETDIPWDQLAFPVIRETLKLYYQDKKAGKFRTHTGDIIRNGSDILVIYP